MALLLDSWFADLVLVLCGVVVAIYLRFRWLYSYWARKGVPSTPASFPFGHCRDSTLIKRQFVEELDEMCQKLKGSPFIGYYNITDPQLLVTDPELIRHIMVKDFNVFVDRERHTMDEPLLHNLFFMKGERWRRLRQRLSPVFTAGKLKNMFPTLEECGRELTAVLEGPAARGEVLEFREVCARYTSEIIGSLAFGLKLDSQRNLDCPFRKWAHVLFRRREPTKQQLVVSFVGRWLGELMRFSGTLKRFEVFTFFHNMVNDTMEQRIKNKTSRNDFMELFIQLHQKGFVEGEKADKADNWKLSADEVAAHAFLFFTAGFETSSTAMSYTIYELALNPDIQKKAQLEIDAALKENKGELSYDVILGMKYLDKVLSEGIRKYPPVPTLTRLAVQPYRIPGTDVVLDEGTIVSLSVLSLHHDERYYPDPERFDPERFSPEAKAARHPFAYLPFGEGPRFCIGMRLGLLQAKLGLICLLSRYNVMTCSETTIPLTLDPYCPVLGPPTGVKLKITSRS